MQNRVFVFGSLNIDFCIQTALLPSAGQTLLGKSYLTVPGGKGANQALAAALLRAPTYLIGAIGNDGFGKTLIANLKKQKVKTSFVKTVKSTSGTAFITVNNNGQNTIVVIPGANHLLTKAAVNDAIVQIRPGDIVVTQLESPINLVQYILKETKKRGATTILNPSPFQDVSKTVFSFVNILIVNETEAKDLTKQKVFSVEGAKQALIQLGIKTCIITRGEKGAVLYQDKKIQRFKALKVKSVDTTAAGDACTGAIASALAQHKPIEEAIRIGTIAGALTTTKYGAQPSLPHYNDVYTTYQKLYTKVT